MTTELHALTGALQETADQLREQSDRTHQDLRDQLHSQSASLAGDFSHKHAELSALLEEAVRQLSTQETDQTSLVALFQELSQRLSSPMTSLPSTPCERRTRAWRRHRPAALTAAGVVNGGTRAREDASARVGNRKRHGALT